MFELFRKLNYPLMYLSFAVGVLYVYFSEPDMKTLVKYPTPDNAGKITYMDTARTCYQYITKERPCPKNPDEISAYPVQI